MKITYDKVKNDIWDIIKDKTDFVYESSNDCDVCEQHNEWDFDPEAYGGEPPTCKIHYDGDACRYFYADEKGSSNSNAPACVVGNWFVHNNFTKEDLKIPTWEHLEGQGVNTIVSSSNLDVDEEAKVFLNHMQTYQDTGVSWGDAYELSVAKMDGESIE